MSYQEYQPSKTLSPYIDAYWEAESEANQVTKILPDGGMDIVFDKHKGEIRVSGMMTTYQNVQTDSSSSAFGIRFQTGCFSTIAHMPMQDIKNITISASDVIPRLSGSFLDKLFQYNHTFDRIEFLEKFLKNQLNNTRINDTHDVVLSVCHAIQENYQKVNFSQLAYQYHISLRQLERKFKHVVGVTMKEYQRIVRFQHTYQTIVQNPTKSLLHTAYDQGYFDHAHLTKELFKMGGINPSEI